VSAGYEKKQRVVNSILYACIIGDGDVADAGDQFVDVRSRNRVSPDPPKNARLVVVDVVLGPDGQTDLGIEVETRVVLDSVGVSG